MAACPALRCRMIQLMVVLFGVGRAARRPGPRGSARRVPTGILRSVEQPHPGEAGEERLGATSALPALPDRLDLRHPDSSIEHAEPGDSRCTPSEAVIRTTHSNASLYARGARRRRSGSASGYPLCAGVDHDARVGVAAVLLLADHELAVPSGRAPVHAAQGVARAVLAGGEVVVVAGDAALHELRGALAVGEGRAAGRELRRHPGRR